MPMIGQTKDPKYETLNGDDRSANSLSVDDAAGVTGNGLKAPGGGARRAPRSTARAREREDVGAPGTALCPTCHGHGKVPKEQERNLLALIPADDDRLKVYV